MTQPPRTQLPDHRSSDPQDPQAERDAVRQKLQRSLDNLADRANLQLQMQKDPLKMIGGASGVGLALGLLVGRQLRRSKKIYVDASSPKAQQKALVRAQARSGKGGASIGGALLATAATLAFKVLQDRVIAPRLEGLADQLMHRVDERQASRDQAPKAQVAQVDGPRMDAQWPAAAPAHVDLHKDDQR